MDEYHLWLNTNDNSDVQYIRQLACMSPKIRVVEPPMTAPGPNVFTGIPQFFRGCTDEQTIYVRFDDDIVYLEPLFFEKLLRFRVDHPEYFLVFPNIINNAICTYILHSTRVIDADAPIYPWCMDLAAWRNPRLAEQLHRAFLRSLARGEIADWHFGVRQLAFCWFSVNCTTWFGKEFSAFKGEVVGNEEEYLTILKPSQLMRLNCIYGDAIAAHFAFYVQRRYLDATDLLRSYASLCQNQSDVHPNHKQFGNSVHTRHENVRDRNIWTARLLDAIAVLRDAPETSLRKVEFLTNLIRKAGLAFDDHSPYGADNQYMNAGPSGVWQVPMQVARCLLHLSRYPISTMIECGTSSGWTTAILTTYLLRFNPQLRVTTSDLKDLFKSYSAVKELLPIDYRPGTTSAAFHGQRFDLALIGGDGSYEGCRSDYFAVGVQAAICVLRNINDKYAARIPIYNGGAPRLWHELKLQTNPPDETFEFLDHSKDDQVMGIGVLVREVALRNEIRERGLLTV